MKKSILIAGLMAVVAGLSSSSASAQGFVLFNNTSAAKVSVNAVGTGLAAISSTAGTAGYYFSLLYSTASNPTVGGSTNSFAGNSTSYAWTSGFTDSTLIATNNSASAGRFAPVTSQVTANGETVSGLAGGSYGSFVIVGWSSNIGSTLASVETYLAGNTGGVVGTGYFGESAISVPVQIGDGNKITTPGLTGTTTGLIPGFTLGQVVVTPEPSTIALGAMGVASLLAFRRKKA